MEKQRTLLILSLILNFLLVLITAFLILLHFNIIDFDRQPEDINQDDNISQEDGTEDEELENNGEEDDDAGGGDNNSSGDDEVEVKEEPFSNIEVLELETYKNDEMGFTFDFPATSVINGSKIYLAAMQKSYYQELIENCVFVGPVEDDSKAYISIGYDPATGEPNNCFRSGVGGGEQSIEEVEMQIGDEIAVGEKLTYIGEREERSFVNYAFQFDNPNMSDSEYNYFGIQIEYYPELEDTYLDLYKEILKTFEWL